MNRTISLASSTWMLVCLSLCIVSFFLYAIPAGAEEADLSTTAAAAGAVGGVGQQGATGASNWRSLHEGLPARREAVRKVESTFVENVTKNGPPTAKLNTAQQEQLRRHVVSASAKMESALEGLLVATSDAERLAYRIAEEQSVLMEEVNTHLQNVRTILSDTRGDIAMFSNISGLMVQASSPLSLYPDVREASSIVYEQLSASRDILIEVATVLSRNGVPAKK